MTNYKGETYFLVGGWYNDSTTLSSVSRYSIGKDLWVLGTPALKVAKTGAAACTLGDSVFVFAN